MNLLGVRLNLLIGPDPVALPAPLGVLEALSDIEVTHSDRERSGFRISFAIGRSGPIDLLDYDLVLGPLLQVGARVVLTVIFDITPRVIMDGIVTRRDVIPGDEPGQGRLVLTGEDISIAMDREQKKVEHPAQDETIIANKIAASYAQYLMVPKVIPPLVIDPPIPLDRTPQQSCTDWAYLNRMAKRFGYVTYVDAGPVPLSNTLYWGPPVVTALPQKALNVNLGPLTNVIGISMSQDALSTTLVKTSVKDRITGKDMPVLAVMPARMPLGAVPTSVTNMGSLRTVSMETTGLNTMQAFARAQGKLNASSDDAIQVSGTLDSVKYNDVLKAREWVGLRGVGFSFDGTYLVRSVTHQISRGGYKQDFVLSRSELGALTPIVRVA
jgi:hypothetical protein